MAARCSPAAAPKDGRTCRSVTPAAQSSAELTGAGARSSNESERFPKSHRLKNTRLIRSLFDREQPDVHHTSSGSIRAVFRFVPAADYPRVSEPVQTGFFVGRKVGKAVVRNRIRRRMREAYRPVHGELLRVMSDRPEVLALGLVFRGVASDTWENISGDLSDVVHSVIKQARLRTGRRSERGAGAG